MFISPKETMLQSGYSANKPWVSDVALNSFEQKSVLELYSINRNFLVSINAR